MACILKGANHSGILYLPEMTEVAVGWPGPVTGSAEPCANRAAEAATVRAAALSSGPLSPAHSMGRPRLRAQLDTVGLIESL